YWRDWSSDVCSSDLRTSSPAEPPGDRLDQPGDAQRLCEGPAELAGRLVELPAGADQGAVEDALATEPFAAAHAPRHDPGLAQADGRLVELVAGHRYWPVGSCGSGLGSRRVTTVVFSSMRRPSL